MKVYFGKDALAVLYTTPLKDLRGKQKYPFEIIKAYKKRIQLLTSIDHLNELRQFRGLNFENLKGERESQYSIRLNKQYRLIITPEEEDNVEVIIIEEISKHYE